MSTAQYSRAVLIGLQRHGISAKELPAVTGLSKTDVRLVLEGKKRLKDADLANIEHATGMSAGKLAILAAGASDKQVVSLLDAWAESLISTQATTTD